ncbi:MAG TPA: ABC transporter ATP-binding protein [Ktedonobacterales bacterium]|nr:ABC transporter ATP-binding protein [Ktedonobacterales bacterium]
MMTERSDAAVPAQGSQTTHNFGVLGSLTPVLDIQDVTFNYGGVQALAGATVKAPKGRVTGLIGPNGAGKSTLVEIIAGGLKPSSGHIYYEGRDIAGLRREELFKLGIARTFQQTRLLPRLSVLENVMIAAPGQTGENLLTAMFGRRRWAQQERRLIDRADYLLDWLQLARLRDQPARVLSGGQRRLLEIARALMAEPRLLLLDEPGSGVYPALMRLIGERIREIVSDNVSVLLVAHNMAFVSLVCDYVVVMDQGQVLTAGQLDEVRANKNVVEAYLGF